MILKLLVFAIVAWLLYRLVGGKLPSLPKRKPPTPPRSTEETMVECAKCSTYASIKEAYLVQGKYYCSQTCIPT